MPTADSVKAKLQGLIATANETTGGNDTTLMAAVNTLVGGYGQGGSTPGLWSRPWDWPNYDTLERPTSDVLYFTYDNRYELGYVCFPLWNGGIVSRGQINNGSFEEIETETVPRMGSYKKWLSPDLGKYVCYRVLPLEGSVLELYLFKWGDGLHEGISFNRPLEVWGRVKNGKIMTTWNASAGGILDSTRALTLYDFSFPGVVSSFYVRGKSLEFANYNDWSYSPNSTGWSSAWRETRLLEIIIPTTWDTSNVTNMSSVFYKANAERIVMREHNVQSVTRTDGMVRECKALITADFSGCDFSAVTNMSEMFRDCTELTDVYIDIIPVSISFYNSNNLSYDSIIRIINALKTVTTTQTLTLGTKNLAKLTDGEKAIATEKGWTLA